MGKPLSLDLRRRIVCYVEQGNSCHAAARKFDVSVSCVIKLMNRVRATGSFEPARQGRPRGSQLDDARDFLVKTVEARSDITMPELSECLLEARGLEVDPAVLSRYLISLGFTYKKIPDRHGARTRSRAP